jgi:hypothetical protein
VPAFFLFIALAAPSHAGWIESRLQALEAYRADVAGALERSRDSLEDLQEATLAPGRSDDRVELALVRLDVAEAYLQKAFDSMERDVSLDTSAPAGWQPWDDRLARAKAIVERSAPELKETLEKTPIHLAPLTELALAQARGADEIFFRGYDAVNPVSPEFLAAQLAHEATHVRQAVRAKAEGRAFRNGPASEGEAREAEAKVWLALGRPEALDFRGILKANADAYKAGPQTFSKYVAARFSEEPDWVWIEPKPAPPAKPPVPKLGELEARAEQAGAEDPKALARQAREIADLQAQIRKNHSTAAANRLKEAREKLEQVVELAAPFPTVVNIPLLETNAVSSRRYPEAMWRAFQAASPALVELDRAREALGRRKLSADERQELRRYLASRDEAVKKPFEAKEAAEALAKLEGGAALSKALGKATVVLVRSADPELEKSRPDWVFVPGSRLYRKPDARSAFAWTVQSLAQRSGKQELDAAELGLQALDLWPSKDEAMPLRWMAERAAWEEGGRPLLRLYLESRKD